jgi:hypothetical protein
LQQLNATVQKAGETGNLNQACQNQASDRESQLCAQWQSADAGKASAIWTERTFWLGLGGTVVGLLALAAAGLAAKFANDAVRETRRIGEAQARAYLSIARVDGYRSKNGVAFEFTLQNSGQSPAIEVAVFCKVVLGDGRLQKIPMQPRNASVPANSSQSLPHVYYLNEGAQKWSGIVIQVGLGYADVFGNIHTSKSDFVGNPDKWLESRPTSLIDGSFAANILHAGIVEVED